ncbi:MAG TPA: UDP-2,3-diacylglucosamine diphosphatase LpxI [Thermoguttaceae bacterium]|nr:UDP-2,3-diacylglucosamine diphosphatase LpxI [Thermoguttaceae bacterium]
MGGTHHKTTRIDAAHQRRPGRIGLIAGWGDYPLRVAQALRRQGYRVYCLGVIGEADPRLADLCDEFRYNGLAKFGAAIRYFKRHGITDATMAGKIHKVALFRHWGWLRYLPDLRTIRMFIPHFLTRRKDCRDDTLLGAVVDEFASEGIRFAPATDYAPELLLQQGQLTRRGPSAWQQKDIEFGWQLAKELGRLDVGQSVAVKDQAVLALEAIEGTDECIRRAGRLCKSGRFTVVKTAKPGQDMRFDVPTIGLGTLQTMVEAGAAVLAVEADRTIILNESESIDFANRNKLVIVALDNRRPKAILPTASAADSSNQNGNQDIPETPSRSRER